MPTTDAYGAEVEAPQTRSELDASWFWRRLIVLANNVFAMAFMVALLIWGEKDNPLHQILAFTVGGAWASINGYYFGFSTSDDRSRRQAWSAIETTRIRASVNYQNPPPAPGRLDGVTG